MVGWRLCSQLRASSELEFSARREGGGMREAGSTVTGSLVVLLSGGYATDSAKAEDSSIVDEPGEG